MLLLEHATDPVAAGRVQDPAAAEPERDVVAVADEIAGTKVALLDALARVLLLVGVARHHPPEPPVGHVDEPGAVDPGLGHPAPLVRGAEVRARLLDRVAFP